MYSRVDHALDMARGSNDPDPESDPPKKAQYGCELAPRLPPGVSMTDDDDDGNNDNDIKVSMTDVRQNMWTLGKSIGSGGFGDIYLIGNADDDNYEDEDDNDNNDNDDIQGGDKCVVMTPSLW